MHYNHILTLLAFTQIAIANPISLKARAKGDDASKSSQGASTGNNKGVTKDSVEQAAKNFAKDAGIVSNAINTMTSMTDKAAIKATAQKAFNAESDEDNQRRVLAAAAGSNGDKSNGLIMKFTPTVLDGLDAITKDASPESVQKNTVKMEGPRNKNILPSITQLSNAALDAMGSSQTAPKLKSTTGATGSGNTNKNGNGAAPGTTGSGNVKANNNGKGADAGATGSGNAKANKNGNGADAGATGSGNTKANNNGKGADAGATGSGNTKANNNGKGAAPGATGSGNAKANKNGNGNGDKNNNANKNKKN